jgi:class I fructose-bisphosphate aldolase
MVSTKAKELTNSRRCAVPLSIDKITELLGPGAEEILDFTCQGVPSSSLYLPGPDYVDRVVSQSNRPNPVLGSLQRLFGHGRLANTGHLSILPVDQGVEHSGSASFAPNPVCFDPAGIVQLAIEGGCNGVASTLGVLGAVSRLYAHKIPFIAKINHNEFLGYPNTYDQIMFGSVKQAFDMGAVGVGATIYFGSPESHRQIVEVTKAFALAHEMGMFTVLWCYLRNPLFKIQDTDYHTAADLTGQANHLGVTLQADIIKQKLPDCDGGFGAVENLTHESYSKYSKKMYGALYTTHPVDMVRYQVANCYMGRAGLINSGGASAGANDLADAVRTAVINKRGGGMGMICGRKAFQRKLEEGVELIHAIQDVYLCKDVTVA